MLVTYFVKFRELNDHLFGKELFIRFTASAFRKLPSVYVFSYFPFGFEGRMWDLFVSVPDHWFSFCFSLFYKMFKCSVLEFRLQPTMAILQGNVLGLMEGSDLQIDCLFLALGDYNKFPEWTKQDDDNFAIQTRSLHLYDLQKLHSGNYTCSSTGSRRQLSYRGHSLTYMNIVQCN